VAQGLEDLDTLLLTDREILDRGRGVDVEVVLLSKSDDAFRGAAVIDEWPRLDGLTARMMLSATVKTGMSMKC